MLEVREAVPGEYPEVAELTARVYLDEGFGSADYEPALRDVAGRAAAATVLVAAEGGQLLGTATVATSGGPLAERAAPGEGHLRMLAVSPAGRGRGVGESLVREAVRRCVGSGCDALTLSTQPGMLAAQRLYARLGFVRQPDRDWSPRAGVSLLAFRLDLGRCDHCGELRAGDHDACRAARELEPPRYCARCGRRLVVQVTPGGWTARCSRHGPHSPQP